MLKYAQIQCFFQYFDVSSSSLIPFYIIALKAF
jgi:hypothetical protein